MESTKKQQTKPAAKEVVEVPQPVADGKTTATCQIVIHLIFPPTSGSWIEVTAKKTKKSPSTKPPKKEDSITEVLRMVFFIYLSFSDNR